MIEEKEEFLTCKYDAIFKTVVIDQNNPKILEAILSNILGGKPKIISWPRTFIPKTNANEKSKERDLVVELDGTYINLEVVTGHGREVRSQLFTYHTSMWSQNILQGEKYDTDTLFLQIVLQFNSSVKKPLMREYKMQYIDPKTRELDIWIENFKTIEVNMERLKKMWYDGSIKDIEKYKYLMMIDMDASELENLKLKGSDDVVEEYADKVGKLNKNLNFINKIGKEREREYVFNTRLHLAREEGIEQGLEQGKINLIENMLKNDLTVEEISKLTNLSVDEINNLLEH